MNKKLAIIAVASTVLIILGGINTTFIYGTQYVPMDTGLIGGIVIGLIVKELLLIMIRSNLVRLIFLF